MALWQHRARLIVAVIGIATAIAVYAAMREREVPVSAPPPERVDPAAIIESTGNVVQQVRGAKQDFLIKAERQLTYEGGATKLVGVEISIANREGRDYVIRAREAQAGQQQQELQLRGDVRLESNDGFELTTTEAFFNENDGQMRAPGDFAFKRRLMIGRGSGMTYDRTNDVLTVVAAADIRLTDDTGNTRTLFTAGNAVFARPSHIVVLGGTVHILHNDQVADAMRASVYLTEDDSLLTRLELRDNAEVNGGGKGVERLRGQSIDLDYGDDGQTVSNVLLQGDASVLAAGSSGGSRDIRGHRIDISMTEEGALSTLMATDSVHLLLPAHDQQPPRRIDARQLAAQAAPNGSLSEARFDGAVVYREQGKADGDRTVRSRTLRVALTEDAITSATFAGGVEFEEGGLTAAGSQIAYSPSAGSLAITGSDTGGGPRVNDEQVSVEAARINVQIVTRDMTAAGNARTTLRPRADRATDRQPTAAPATGTKLPGLFEQGRAASGNADAFEYSASGGQVLYVGNATLSQGETAVRGDRVSIDRASGDLRVTGMARSSLRLANGQSDSRSTSLSYVEGKRTITYQGDASLTERDGQKRNDLRAASIVVMLAAASNRVETMTASTNVSLKLDARAVTGERLTYEAAEERYVMTGAGRTPVKIVENCRETTGSTLTFFRSADTIVVDGNEATRTQSVRGQQCSESRR